jgi:hypothetical protein
VPPFRQALVRSLFDPALYLNRGLLVPGNIDLNRRPVVRNPDGSVSTVRSASILEARGREVLVPTVVGGRVVSDRQAWLNYLRTGRHLGVFTSPAHADAYAQLLHQAQARRYGSAG